KLENATFAGANLSHAILGTVSLIGTDFGGANLSRANFGGGLLLGVNVSAARLAGTSFWRSIFAGVILANNDLSETIGLEEVMHAGPSTVGIDTIYKSQAKIPESFLRGCGVSENFVTQMAPLIDAEEGIQFYSCFIAHSS